MNEYDKVPSSVEDRLDYIASCQLPEGDSRVAEVINPTHRRSRRSLAVDEKAEGAAVVANSIVSFVAGMSKQSKEDIKNAVLFATLVANKAHPNMSGPLWYEQFVNVMIRACGWVPTRREYSKYTASEHMFTMDQVGLKILASAVAAVTVPGATAAVLVGVAQQALEALQASDKPLKLFEGKSRRHNGGAFSIASCVESADGEVAMAMGSVDFSSVLSAKNVLFWDWNSNSVSISRAESCLVLNQNIYAEVRDSILRKLGTNAKQAIEEYEI
ncbi:MULTISPECIES: hypothetical protein [unclassified Pseudomonas]|uniref:hypothetical protein n=1 Tax=unclassified Pseudomonas TaxID=196821 RepID=UPI002B233EBB|nr:MULTISPECIES: hypothetical protein [unclassified Pseudomonas]MEA9977603.1 hypothetical protein [Pseudomonas sp. RTS4]MEB0196626.1 hypothetical protein [Pseudomonas sp. 5S4]MEB0244527.1 hypothetical protein [Pseudomonas sp. 10S5]